VFCPQTQKGGAFFFAQQMGSLKEGTFRAGYFSALSFPIHHERTGGLSSLHR